MNIVIEAEMSQKAEKFYLSSNEVVKIIELEKDEFQRFKHDPLGNYSFIAENSKLATTAEGWMYQCLLILGKEQDDGILVNTAGNDYARHTSYVPNARSILMVRQMPQALRELNQKVLDAIEQTTNRCIQLVEQDGSGYLSFDEIMDVWLSFKEDSSIQKIYSDAYRERLSEYGISVQHGGRLGLQLDCPAIRQERHTQERIDSLIPVCDAEIYLGPFEYPESDYPWAIVPVKDSAEMLEHFKFGNYATRSGFLLDDLAFVEMASGCNEWLTLKHDGDQWHSLNVYSMYHILQKQGPGHVQELVEHLKSTPYSDLIAERQQAKNTNDTPAIDSAAPELSPL